MEHLHRFQFTSRQKLVSICTVCQKSYIGFVRIQIVICAKINKKSTQCVILYSPLNIKRVVFRQTCVSDGATELPPEISTV